MALSDNQDSEARAKPIRLSDSGPKPGQPVAAEYRFGATPPPDLRPWDKPETMPV